MIIDGKQISLEVLKELKEYIRLKNLKLRLAAVLVSNNLGIRKFVELKGKAAKEAGIDYDIFEFPETITEPELKQEVRKLVEDDKNNGVLVELPLPEGINAQNVLNEITLNKDVDVLSRQAQDKFYEVERGQTPNGGLTSSRPQVLPPAVEALNIVLDFYKFSIKNKPRSRNSESFRDSVAEPQSEFSLQGKKAVVFGQGILVGKPISHWLEQQGVETFRIDENTKNPEKYSLRADIIVSGVGKPELIDGDMVKNGTVAIDFGYENKEGKMVGDFNFDEVSPKAGLITPVPGGIGPVVVAAVLKNLVKINS